MCGGSSRRTGTVRPSKWLVFLVLAMVIVATTESSMIGDCIKRCRDRHEGCYNRCLADNVVRPERLKVCCHKLCHIFTHTCIVACHQTKGFMP